MPAGQINRVLIANRGEISVRVARACRDAGIESVAIYSDADAGAPHVLAADHAIRVGPAPAAESYLDADAVLDAARATHADALHPGYGFLSENADFAEATESAGIVWIGPAPETIRLMGDKVAARQTAAAAGLPVIPGSVGPLTDADDAARVATETGYPALLKAAGGGGGRGIRKVESPADIQSAFDRASSEALEAFGDGRLYLERYITDARHVEIQVLADGTGQRDGAVHLGERECSLQRRNQKLFEEHPSPAVDAELRQEMGEKAAIAAAHIGYRGVGTMEFLLTDDGYYFMEMNTRLQVEHPVTELVTGIDLVQAQFDVAAGRGIPFSQDEIRFDGAAVEARIYAEDPARNFAPSAGRIGSLHLPAGDHVRVDRGVDTGTEISPYYDSLLMKVICRGPDRAAALDALESAIHQLIIGRIDTTAPLFLWLLEHPDFRQGKYHTGALEALLKERTGADQDAQVDSRAAIAATLFTHMRASRTQQALSQRAPLSAWQKRDGLGD